MVFQDALRKKCPYSEYFWSMFPRIFQYLSVLNPNAGKCEQKNSRDTYQYRDTFHAVMVLHINSENKEPLKLKKSWKNLLISTFEYLTFLKKLESLVT